MKACAALGGYKQEDFYTPVNEVAQKIFAQLLTPYLAEQLNNEDPHQVNIHSNIVSVFFYYFFLLLCIYVSIL